MGTFKASAAATLQVALLAAPSHERVWLSSSNAGSGLPWWTPLGVSVLLLLLSFIYRVRHRPLPPGETPHPFGVEEEHEDTKPSVNNEPKNFFWRRFVIGEHRKVRQV